MTIPYHPLAELFPLMEGAAFEELVADIKAHGLHNPITLYETNILDGRNRERACEEAGVEPFYDSYDGDDPLGFVVSQNVARRHLDDSQRAMIAARVENMPPHRPAGKDANLHTSRNEAARLLSVSVRSVASASAVLDKADPAVVKAVEQGRVTVSCASEIIKLNLDSEDTSELMTLPKADIPRNVERLKTEAKRKEAFERMTPQELEAFADPDTSDADNDAVIAAVAKCQKVMRNLKPRLILSVALELKDWAESRGRTSRTMRRCGHERAPDAAWRLKWLQSKDGLEIEAWAVGGLCAGCQRSAPARRPGVSANPSPRNRAAS